MSFRDTASFGKRQEFIVIAELLRRNFDVYLTLVDDQGIDCVIRLDASRYIDIQIKARSRTAKYWNLFAAMDFVPRDNYFFIFYLERNDTTWIIPSEDVAELSSQNLSGKNKGKRTLSLPTSQSGSKARRFASYLGDKGFDRLRRFGLERS